MRVKDSTRTDVTIIESNQFRQLRRWESGRPVGRSVVRSPLVALIRRYAPYFTHDASVYVIDERRTHNTQRGINRGLDEGAINQT